MGFLYLVLSFVFAFTTQGSQAVVRDFDYWAGEFSKHDLTLLPVQGVRHSFVKVWSRHQGGLPQHTTPKFVAELVRWNSKAYAFPIIKPHGQGPEVGNILSSVGAIEDGKPCLRIEYPNAAPARLSEARMVSDGQYLVLTYRRGSTKGRIEGDPDIYVLCSDWYVKQHQGRCRYMDEDPGEDDEEDEDGVIPIEL